MGIALSGGIVGLSISGGAAGFSSTPGLARFIGEIGGGLHTPQEIEDNAKLVSTAPKMVEILKYLNNCGGLGFEKHKFIEDVLTQAGQQ